MTNVENPETGIRVIVERKGSGKPNTGKKGEPIRHRGGYLDFQNTVELKPAEIDKIINTVRKCLDGLGNVLGREVSSLQVLNDHSGHYPEQQEISIDITGRS